MITVDYNQAAVQKVFAGLKIASSEMRKAEVSATNKTAVSTRSYVVKAIAKDYRVKQKDIRKELNLSRATYKNPVADIWGGGSPGIALYDFAPTPKRTPSTKRTKRGKYTPKTGIKVMVRRGNRKVVKGAFIAKMRSGHIGVFRRSDKKGLPIDELFGPSPIRLADADYLKPKIDIFVGATMDKNIAREADYYLKRAGVIPR